MSCSSSASISTARSRSRSDQTGSSAGPVTVASSSRSLSPTAGPKKVACTPHSYSAPQRAHVRSIISSRSLGSSNPCPRMPAPSGRIRAARDSWTTSVRNSASGSTSVPGGIHFRSISSTSGEYGGSTGAIRAVWIWWVIGYTPLRK